MMRWRVWLAAAVVLMMPGSASAQVRPPLVLAAASLQESLTAAAGVWQARGHPAPRLSFAASSALARQIEAGAPADLFVSADEVWMDDVARKQLIVPATRVSFLGNRLVLIAPATKPQRIVIRPGFPLADPAAVPAGVYARAALTRLGVWPSVAGRLAAAENVRAAMVLVERNEAPLGIVYATDAMASRNVRVAGIFPAASHPAITYPIARLKTATSPDAEGFRAFLVSPAGKAIFARYGFLPR
jgi:molybdate transport system substrate-binding protein